MKRPFQSLSVKLTLVFFVTAVVYLYGLSVGIRYLIDEDELREIIGYYQTSYYDYMLSAKGSQFSNVHCIIRTARTSM